MSLPTLKCPRCQKPLVHVRIEGLTLYYRCDRHGALTLRPLVEVDEPDESESPHEPHANEGARLTPHV